MPKPIEYVYIAEPLTYESAPEDSYRYAYKNEWDAMLAARFLSEYCDEYVSTFEPVASALLDDDSVEYLAGVARVDEDVVRESLKLMLEEN